MPRELKHIQAPIYEDGEVVFQVDKKLQSLIQHYWDHGIETFNSCENNVRDTCWIQYLLEDWMFINETAFQLKSRGLSDFIVEKCEVLLLNADDGHPDENDDYWIEGENLIWTASVRFPRKLLPEFETLIRAHFAILSSIDEQNLSKPND